jgi:hypothetical protein
MKDSASAQNIIVAFYREYSRYHYLYFTTWKLWSKDLLSIKGVSISQHTSIARARGKGMIGIKHNDTQGINH